MWHSGKVPVSHTADSGFEYSNLFKVILLLSRNSANSVKTFRENSTCHPAFYNTEISSNFSHGDNRRKCLENYK